jgi:hypothetical protein
LYETSVKGCKSFLISLGLIAVMGSANAVTALGVWYVDIENDSSVPASEQWLQIAEVVALDTSSNPVSFTSAVASNPLVNDGVSHYGTPADNARDGSLVSNYPSIYHASNLGESLRLTFATPVDLSSLTIYGRSDYGYRDVYRVQLTLADFPGPVLTMDATNGSATAVFAPVPEPGELAMMLSGLATVGLIAKRRRKQAA